MRWFRALASATALFHLGVTGLNLARQVKAVTTSALVDPLTGLTFAALSVGGDMGFRVAVPATKSTGSYQAVVQIMAPVKTGWAALAWGGGMTNNPLTVAWVNGNNVTVSSRFATGHSLPAVYASAAYTVIPKGTFVNSTHWQVTALCEGCTTWSSSAGARRIDPADQNAAMSWATSTTGPSKPADPASPFGIHDKIGGANVDMSQGANTNFTITVARHFRR